MSFNLSRQMGIMLLLIAGLVVAVAILVDGTASRGINGVGGILWIAALVLVWRGIGSGNRHFQVLALALAVTLVLVLFIKPSDLFVAAAGFGVAGALVGLVARRTEVLWAAMVPALWLPIHLSIALGRAVLGTSGEPTAVRTDPPPTEAFVPFVMVVSSVVAGLTVAMIRRSREERTVGRRAAERPTGLEQV